MTDNFELIMGSAVPLALRYPLSHRSLILNTLATILIFFISFSVLQYEDLAVRSLLRVLPSSLNSRCQEGEEQVRLWFASVLVKYLIRDQAGYVAHDQRDCQSKWIIPHVRYTIQIKVRRVVRGAENENEIHY